MKRLWDFLCPPVTPTLENHPYALASKADDHIVSHILDSIAKDYDGWQIHSVERASDLENGEVVTTSKDDMDRWDIQNGGQKKAVWQKYGSTVKIRRRSGGLLVESEGIWRRSRDGDGLGPWIYSDQPAEITVNGLAIDKIAAKKLLDGVKHIQANRETMRKQAEEAQRIADAVAERMRQDEAKWNLAEQLLNMVRDENGALKPKPPEVSKPKAVRKPRIKKDIMA